MSRPKKTVTTEESPKKPKQKRSPRNGGKPIVEVTYSLLSDKLTPLQKIFVTEYLVDLSAPKAYMRSGFAYKDYTVAAKKAKELLSEPHIIDAIEKAYKERAERTRVTADIALLRLQEEMNYYGKDASHAARVRSIELFMKHLGLLPTAASTTIHQNNNVLMYNGSADPGNANVLQLSDIPPELAYELYKLMEAKGVDAIDLAAFSPQKALPAPGSAPPVIVVDAPMATDENSLNGKLDQ